jgi:type IV pilus assembly protein PilP
MKIIRTIMLASVVGLGACSQGMGDLEQYVAEVKARKTAKIDPIPQIKPYEAVAYVAGDRRDPFVPATPDRDRSQPSASAVPGPDRNRNREPLEEFPVDSLRMVGTIDFNGHTYALVKAPDSVIHRVTIGDHMGQNYGKIVTITPSEVDLSEVIPDGFGGWTERPASLALEE